MRRSSEHLAAGLATALLAATCLAAQPALADPASASHAYAGLRKTIAVDTFQTPDSIIGLQGTSEGLTSMLTDALVHDPHYVVVERDAMPVIAAEQQLGATNATTAETSAATGRLIGANLIVRGAVTKFDPQQNNGSFSIAGVGLSSARAYIAVTLRVFDTTTGQVVATSRGEGTASTRGFSVNYVLNNGQPINFGTQHETPLGQAAEEAIERAVAGIASAAETAPWSAMVIDADDSQVFVNAGADQNLAPDTVLHVYRKARNLVDPATGVVLETIMSDVGQIRITQVRDKTSTAEVVSGPAPTRGDVLRLQ
ncbi:MAG: CsgG/HfaB family protein [Caulobacterales bacterium]